SCYLCGAPGVLSSVPTRRSSDLVFFAASALRVSLLDAGVIGVILGLISIGFSLAFVYVGFTLPKLLRGSDKQYCKCVSERDNKRSEEHTSELQLPDHIVCRLLLE